MTKSRISSFRFLVLFQLSCQDYRAPGAATLRVSLWSRFAGFGPFCLFQNSSTYYVAGPDRVDAKLHDGRRRLPYPCLDLGLVDILGRT
jgi:hypothetical protein